MEKLPKISVIIPLYNCENEIKKCLKSIINQSYKNLEILVVNDASTDKSKETVEKLIDSDNRIRLINLQKNAGAGNARNIGLDNATGELIAFIDSDDWIDTNFYNILYDNMRKYNSDIAVAGILNEYEYKSKSEIRYKYEYDNCLDNFFALELLSRSINQDIYITPIVNNKLYKKELFLKHNIKYDKTSLYEDDAITFWLLYYAKKVSITSKTNYHYLQRENSLVHTFNKKHIDDLFENHKRMMNIIEEKKLYDIKETAQKYFKKTLFAMLDRLVELVPNKIQQREFIEYLLNKFPTAVDLLLVIDAIDFINMKEFRN